MGMTLRDLGTKAFVSHVSVMRIEGDQFKVVDPQILANLGDALHLDRLFLFSLNGQGIMDKDIRIIARAAEKMSAEQRGEMMKMLRSSFPEAFASFESDDLDDNCES